MSELKKAGIAARIGAAAPDEHQRSTIETWLADGVGRDLSEHVQVKLRLPLRLSQALDRARSITGKSKNALMEQFILEGLRKLNTYEHAIARTGGKAR